MLSEQPEYSEQPARPKPSLTQGLQPDAHSKAVGSGVSGLGAGRAFYPKFRGRGGSAGRARVRTAREDSPLTDVGSGSERALLILHVAAAG